MKLCYTSDLHHGMDNNTYRIHEKFFAEMRKEQFDLLVLAGDIGSHQQRNIESAFKMIRIMCGSHYNKPKYKIIEV